ncbi:MAG: VanZ family protein [Eubacteriales bacterium]|nr:VanZ family protein [Eubacteriales bacterium]
MFYTYGYLFYIPVTLLCIVILLLYGVHKKKPLPYYFISILAVIYVNFFIDYMIFPIIVDDDVDYSIYYNIYLQISLSSISFRHNVLNILATMPIGIGIQFIFDLKRQYRWILAVILAEIPEIVQLILICTIHPINKIFDINDVLLNGIGAIVGFLLMNIINKLVKTPPKDDKTVFRYCWNVCCQTDKSTKGNRKEK